ncbi:hypothetical protein ACHAXS_013381 [Conticribra weissflogii]
MSTTNNNNRSSNARSTYNSHNNYSLRSRQRASFQPAANVGVPQAIVNDEIYVDEFDFDFDFDADADGTTSQSSSQKSKSKSKANNNRRDSEANDDKSRYGYRVYTQRWLMLFYLSLLNLLSDWAGLSVAPIATLTSRAYNSAVDEDTNASESYYDNSTTATTANDNDNDNGEQSSSSSPSYLIQPEALVTTFLIASSLGTALEPLILSRLGLRRTILLGAFCNMLGSLIKSGGLPPLSFLSVPSLSHGLCGTYALYSGFFFVGFAQPLFQCTPSLLSASWFPEEERTLATSIALNANQLGVGCAFIVGALWVQNPSQVRNYFSLLSVLSVAAYVGCVCQLEDAPPTPPSGSSRIMRGTMEWSVRDLIRGAPVEEGAGGKDNSMVSAAWNRSAQSLLKHHFPSVRTAAHAAFSGGSSPDSVRSSLPPPWSPSLLAAPYSADESTYVEGAEPTVTQTPHHLEIDIRDDQILLAAKACFARKGFSHALVVFTVSGIVINTLSTYLDYLVRVSYSDDEGGRIYDERGDDDQPGKSNPASVYVALIGGFFQIIIMLSSVVVGSITDKTRSYFLVTLLLLVFGAVALAECGVSLDEARGGDVRWSLLLVSGLLGPLLPVAAELGVEMAYPLSENTVLVVLQLSCNLLSALFIPLFQAVKNVGVTSAASGAGGYDDAAALVVGEGRPPYTFSFFLLIFICGASAVYFATFDGTYLRLEAEMAKKREEEGDHGPLIPSPLGTSVDVP